MLVDLAFRKIVNMRILYNDIFDELIEECSDHSTNHLKLIIIVNLSFVNCVYFNRWNCV